MEISAGAIPWKSLYKLLIGSIVPRPIGWISSISQDGVPNLAPFSFFNVASVNPPMLLFCPMVREIDLQNKDTLKNVRQTREFVVNIVTEELAQAMNITSTELPEDVDEFVRAGLTAVPALRVRPARVAESPVHYECKLHQIIDFGDTSGSGSLVIGQIVHLHIDENVLIGTDKIDIVKLKPIGRLAGAGYCRVTDMFDLVRPPSQIQEKRSV